MKFQDLLIVKFFEIKIMVNITIEQLFKESPKDPFYYKPQEMLENIKNIFYKGLLISNNKEKDTILQLENINQKDFN